MRSVFALLVLWAIAFGVATPSHAQPLVGTWQGSIGDRKLVLRITTAPNGALHGEFFNLGIDPAANPISSIHVHESHVKFDLDDIRGSFDGDLSGDGRSLSGRWTTIGPSQTLTLERATTQTAWIVDASPHKVHFVPVEPGVQLEVLDWGGSGPPLVLLTGQGDTAHTFDKFAPKFTDKHHVYAITRRGFGSSTKPPPTGDNYDADRLGDDVLAVLDALKIEKPVLAGHSLAGEELSSIGTRHPERVAGLIYLEAVYEYAFYDASRPSLWQDLSTLKRDMLALPTAGSTYTPSQIRALVKDMQAALPDMEAALKTTEQQLATLPDSPLASRLTQRDKVVQAISTSYRKYTSIKGPVLAIVAFPHFCGPGCDAEDAKLRDQLEAPQIDAFGAATPSARMVRIPNAQHYVYRSNEEQVIREMKAFLDGLH